MMQNVSVVLPDQVNTAAQTEGKMRMGGHSGHK
jgi:hypothetical protein